jgi:hypothetical protein
MPRCGVGLNELLGAWDADANQATEDLPKAEAQTLERAPRTIKLTFPK